MSSAPAPHSIGPIRTVSGTIHPVPYPNHSTQQQLASGQNENFWLNMPLGQPLSRNSSSQSFSDRLPSASGQLQTGSHQYPAGPSFQDGDFRTMGRATVHHQATAHERAAEADSIANRLKLSDENRIELHRISQDKLCADLMLHGYCMKLDAQNEDLKNQLKEVFDKLAGIEQRTSVGWTLSKEQEVRAEILMYSGGASMVAHSSSAVYSMRPTCQHSILNHIMQMLLKEVINHWLVKPVNSYKKLINQSVDKYIRQNIKKLHLELYLKDPIIKRTVEHFVNAHQTAQRGNNLRGLGEAIARGDSLEDYCIKMLNSYAQGVDTKPTNVVRGQFALMRFIYHDISLNKRNGKSDPGFWKELETELARLVHVNSKDRKSPKWEEWYVQMIENDKKIFATVVSEILPGLNLEGNGESDGKEAIEVETVQT